MGRCVHKTSNALKMSFQDGPGDPFATAVQSAADGKGAKLGMLFGFKNGGTGTHVLTYADGRELRIQSREGKPSIFTQGDGAEVATIHRGETSTAVLSGGTQLFTFASDPVDARTPELFRVIVTDPDGTEVGRLDVVRKDTGWTLGRVIDTVWDEYIWWDHAGAPLPVPILGTRLMLTRPVSDLQRDVLLGACVDIAIGLRPYIKEMN